MPKLTGQNEVIDANQSLADSLQSVGESMFRPVDPLTGLICSATRKRHRGAKITAALPMASRPIGLLVWQCGGSSQWISQGIGRGTLPPINPIQFWLRRPLGRQSRMQWPCHRSDISAHYCLSNCLRQRPLNKRDK
jgi:hypothetical protein